MKKKRNASFEKKAHIKNQRKQRSRKKYIENILSEIEKSGVKTDSFVFRDSSHNSRRTSKKTANKREEKLTRGVFSSTKSGFGFVRGEDGYSRDIFIPEGNTLGALEGDTVEISYHVYRDSFGEERTEGRVLKILEFGLKTLVGTLSHRRERIYGTHALSAYLIPDDSKIGFEPSVSDTAGAHEGEKVMVLLERKKDIKRPSGRVIARYGDTYSMSANYNAILDECEIPVEFSREELCEAEFFSKMPLSDTDRVRREREVIFTIDSESAKDLDDAISIRKLSGGDYLLGVHIADVSAYVKERSHLDRAVMKRGTSVYFVDKVVPMLPKSLSNGSCSLNPGEEKYALSAIIRLNAKGEIVSKKLEKSIIKSRIKGIYSEINSIFENRADGKILAKYKSVLPSLTKMHALYEILKKKSRLRGALELDGSECEIVLDESGNPSDIVKRVRGDSEKMIEQFMLVANEAVAQLLTEKGVPCVYRIHEGPPPERLLDFCTYLKSLGFDTSAINSDTASSSDYQALLSRASERGLALPVSYTMLRSMSKAKYSEIPRLHFGLGIDLYCHFTSPIRRLSDLATHRIINKVIFEGKRPELYASFAKRAAAAATESELRAVNAERRIENLYKIIYMSKNIGKEYEAIITSVTSFGFFAELDNTCEGLVPISELDGFFTFEEKTLTLRSQRARYSIGDSVRVRLEEADVIRGKLRFSVAEP